MLMIYEVNLFPWIILSVNLAIKQFKRYYMWRNTRILGEQTIHKEARVATSSMFSTSQITLFNLFNHLQFIFPISQFDQIKIINKKTHKAPHKEVSAQGFCVSEKKKIYMLQNKTKKIHYFAQDVATFSYTSTLGAQILRPKGCTSSPGNLGTECKNPTADQGEGAQRHQRYLQYEY